MIDIHVIDDQRFPDRWSRLMEQLGKVKDASIHVVPRVEGSLYLARLNGFQQGTNPFKSYVDGDDELLQPSFYARALRAMEDPTVSVVAGRYITHFEDTGRKRIQPYRPDPPMSTSYPYIHAPALFRTANILASYNALGSVAEQIGLGSDFAANHDQRRYGRAVQLELIAYKWNVRPNPARDLSPALPHIRAFLDRVTANTAS